MRAAMFFLAVSQSAVLEALAVRGPLVELHRSLKQYPRYQEEATRRIPVWDHGLPTGKNDVRKIAI